MSDGDRDLVLRKFFPPPREERTYGAEIELAGTSENTPPPRITIRVDDLAEPLSHDELVRLFDLAALLFATLTREARFLVWTYQPHCNLSQSEVELW